MDNENKLIWQMGKNQRYVATTGLTGSIQKPIIKLVLQTCEVMYKKMVFICIINITE